MGEEKQKDILFATFVERRLGIYVLNYPLSIIDGFDWSHLPSLVTLTYGQKALSTCLALQQPLIRRKVLRKNSTN